MHDAGTVAVEAPHAAVFLLQCYAEGYLAGVAHRAYGEEVALMALAFGGAVLKKLAAYHACGADDDVFVAQGSSHSLDGFLARQLEIAG